VRGVGFYRQFLNTSEWPDFMRAGRSAARRALVRRSAPSRPRRMVRQPAGVHRERSHSRPTV
jgi:hypothetical protein